MNDVFGVVLAAGFGSRLRPATHRCPKPLLPVGGVEPLFLALGRLSDAGVRRVVVNAHHLSERVQATLKDWQARYFSNLEIRCTVESPAILGSGGGLLNILSRNPDWAKNSRMLVLNGDTLTDLDPRSLLEAPASPGRGALFSISTLEAHLERYGPVWIDERADRYGYKGVGRQSRPAASRAAHFLGLHLLEAEAVERLRRPAEFAVRDTDLFGGIYEPLIERGMRVEGYPCFANGRGEKFWFDLNTTEFFLEAQKWLLESLAKEPDGYWASFVRRRHPGIEERAPGVWAYPSAGLGGECLGPVVVALQDAKSLKGRVGPNASLVGVRASLDASLEIREASVLADGEEASTISRRVDGEVLVVPEA